MLHPPPRMNSLPSDTWAASHSSMVTFTMREVTGHRPGRRCGGLSCDLGGDGARPDCAVECKTMVEHVGEMIGLRDDVYRRPLATALSRLGLGDGWRFVYVGAGGGDVSVGRAG